MSRIGKQPINVPSGVEVTIDGSTITVKGPKGELSQKLPEIITIKVEEGQILCERPNDEREARSMHGLVRSLVNNMVVGVTNGYEKVLELEGVGYRALLKGSNLELSLGYSHPVVITPEEGITFEAPTATKIIVRGIDKQKVGQTAAVIRSKRPPEPYKGKGIRYEGEHIRRKLGKAAK